MFFEFQANVMHVFSKYMHTRSLPTLKKQYSPALKKQYSPLHAHASHVYTLSTLICILKEITFSILSFLHNHWCIHSCCKCISITFWFFKLRYWRWYLSLDFYFNFIFPLPFCLAFPNPQRVMYPFQQLVEACGDIVFKLANVHVPG